jgi:hypothetical protein
VDGRSATDVRRTPPPRTTVVLITHMLAEQIAVPHVRVRVCVCVCV